jgi:hypothetical protein
LATYTWWLRKSWLAPYGDAQWLVPGEQAQGGERVGVPAEQALQRARGLQHHLGRQPHPDVVGERLVPRQPQVEVDHLALDQHLDRLAEVERGVGGAREVVRGAQGKQAERHVLIGEQAGRRADRAVAAARHEQVGLEGQPLGQDAREFPRAVDGTRAEQREPGPGQPLLRRLVEQPAAPRVSVDHQHRTLVVADVVGQLLLRTHPIDFIGSGCSSPLRRPRRRWC